MRKIWLSACSGREEALTGKSFAELFAMQREEECRLEALRRKEPREEERYCLWIGKNAACIASLEKIRREIQRRKTMAARAGVNVFVFDGKALRAG